jgi:hypothetical protein
LLLLLRVAPAEVGRALAPELLAGFGAAWSRKKNKASISDKYVWVSRYMRSVMPLTVYPAYMSFKPLLLQQVTRKNKAGHFHKKKITFSYIQCQTKRQYLPHTCTGLTTLLHVRLVKIRVGEEGVKNLWYNLAHALSQFSLCLLSL